MSAATVDQLAEVVDRVGKLISSVQPGQWGDPTPCPEWDVQALVRHLVLGNVMDTSGLLTRPPTYRELLAGFDETAAGLVEAFGQPGILDRILEVPFGRVDGLMALHLRLTELIVHGWDLARATGQQADFPEDVVTQELGFTARALAAIPEPVGTPQSAPPLDQLVSSLGRVA
ncbi:TIGR03086 family metal-binding protein [Actinoplanes sp. TFC3]|uniref:TIGR03086 family metal-binding protein n=1 Tax=Actinoplanes sp. TFC3 TaxID=1710355 RepID=UPI000AAC9DC0|nr:TIGR03086 family metal-binding protein [Actinoplanes sp. TFC3]